jgi:tRNA (guanine37-N1)-methyltransferase
MVMIDCIVRRLPGSLNDAESASQDSFFAVDCWTGRTTRGRRSGTGMKVPDVLLSGNHAAIARWRRKQALGRTWERRPD